MSVGKDRLEAEKILVTAASEPPGWNRISSCLVSQIKKTCLKGIQKYTQGHPLIYALRAGALRAARYIYENICRI